MPGGHGIRRAVPEEAAALTELALRSKAHWGYDAAFLEACRAELTLSPEDVAARPVFVVEERGRVAGFYALDGEPPAAELDDLFLEPWAIGLGVGRRRWAHAVATACRLGFTELFVEADPKAEGFYTAMGAERVGEVESPVRPGRMLPLLRIGLEG